MVFKIFQRRKILGCLYPILNWYMYSNYAKSSSINFQLVSFRIKVELDEYMKVEGP